MNKRTAVIIGAGPAGLTAAYELLEKTNITPIILEMNDLVGGLAKTVNYKGNRIDIGGHRFFSKSNTILAWWEKILPLEKGHENRTIPLQYQNTQSSFTQSKSGVDPETTDEVMLVRSRHSRIYFLGRFFEYPLTLSINTLNNLGIFQTLRSGMSYFYAIIFPREEKSLEDFFINRFGYELYRSFFKEYTEKVWGIPCSEIAPEWGAQRVKGLSLTKALADALRHLMCRDQYQQKETSLIQQFFYPKLGPGQLWEVVARRVTDAGGKLYFHEQVVELERKEQRITAVTTENSETGERKSWEADFFLSTMPIQELIAGMREVPERIVDIARGLNYRDFIVVGLLAKKFAAGHEKLNDNWIYIQDHGIQMGRVQIFNNWSPFLVAQQDTVWIGCEYFCHEDDALWRQNNDDIQKLAIEEVVRLGLLHRNDVLDGVVIRERKAYPSYTGTYRDFSLLREYINDFQNLYCMGRNGMHRYNNQDHSMLTAIETVNHIIHGGSKARIWMINTEEDYHEREKAA